MTILVTDAGFAADDWTRGFTTMGGANDAEALDVPSHADPDQIALRGSVKFIRIDFPSSADGRGFTIARQLRLRGFRGRLRAKGHVLADQYAMAKRSGFDEVEISEELAARQTAEQWLFRADWRQHNYQARLSSTSQSAQ